MYPARGRPKFAQEPRAAEVAQSSECARSPAAPESGLTGGGATASSRTKRGRRWARLMDGNDEWHCWPLNSASGNNPAAKRSTQRRPQLPRWRRLEQAGQASSRAPTSGTLLRPICWPLARPAACEVSRRRHYAIDHHNASGRPRASERAGGRASSGRRLEAPGGRGQFFKWVCWLSHIRPACWRCLAGRHSSGRMNQQDSSQDWRRSRRRQSLQYRAPSARYRAAPWRA